MSQAGWAGPKSKTSRIDNEQTRPRLLADGTMTLFTVLALGFFLGMRHATDADHVVAITTIVSRQRSVRAALAVGALWGLGHSATILAVGGAIVLLGLAIPPRIGLSMELSVAAMLVGLGVMNVTGAMQRIDESGRAGRSAAPSSDGASRVDRHGLGQLQSALRPLVVGVVHGLAGSAAVALLVVATVREPAWAMVYLGFFGAGTVVGMMLLTLTMMVPLAALGRLRVLERFGSTVPLMARCTGFLSIAFGLFLVYKIGFVDGLFTGHPTWSPG